MNKIINFNKDKEKLYQKELYVTFKNIEGEIKRFNNEFDKEEDIVMDKLISVFNKEFNNFKNKGTFLTNKNSENFISNIKELLNLNEENDDILFYELMLILCSKLNRNFLKEDKNYVVQIIKSLSNFLWEDLDIKNLKYTLDILINNKYFKEKIEKLDDEFLKTVIIEDIYEGVPLYYIISELENDNQTEINDFNIKNIYDYYFFQASEFVSMTEKVEDYQVLSLINKITIIDKFSNYSKQKYINIVKEIYSLSLNQNSNLNLRRHLKLIANLTYIFIELNERHILSRVNETAIRNITYLSTINESDDIKTYIDDYICKNDNYTIKLKKGGKVSEN